MSMVQKDVYLAAQHSKKSSVMIRKKFGILEKEKPWLAGQNS